jgi:hypothetical protein
MIDLRKATDEVIREIEKLESVGMMVYGENQQSAISHIKQVNVGAAMSLPEGVDFIVQNGRYDLTRSILETVSTKIVVMVNGKLTIEPLGDVGLLDKIHKITVNGKLIIQENDYVALASRIQVNGNSVVYSTDETFVDGTFVLSDVNLYGLDEGSKLYVDSIQALEPFDETLFDETISAIKVNHYLVASAKYIRKLARKITNYLEIEKHIVPDDFVYYDSLKLDDVQLESLKGENLYIRSSLDIQCSAVALLQKVKKLIAKEVSVSQAVYDDIKGLLDQVAQVKIIDPSAVQNMSLLVLTDYYFKDIASLSMTNYGKLDIDASVTLEILDQKLKHLENYGVVTCPEHLYSKVMQRTKSNFGIIKAKPSDPEASSEVGGAGEVISDMGYLAL